MNLRPFAVLATCLLLSACASVVAAPAGLYTVGTGYKVTLGEAWSDVSTTMPLRPAKVRLLTLDGPLLGTLYLTDGLVPGEFMVKPLAKERPTPTYRKGMAPTELVELVSDSVSALGYQRVETQDLRPAKFAGGDAIRFDLTAQTSEGLNMSATAMVAERGGKLYILLFIAPTEHYFGAHRTEVESILASATPAA